MGRDRCSIFVKHADGDAVIEAIEKYWKKKKALLDSNDFVALEPGAREKEQLLGYAVSPPADGWVAVVDSEVHSADHSLAKHLAKTLKTTVRVEDVMEALEVHHWEAHPKKSKDTLPDDFAHREATYGKREGFKYVQLAKVKEGAYDPHRQEHPDVWHRERCPVCAERMHWGVWGMHKDVDASWASLAEPPGFASYRALVPVDCEKCKRRAVAWLEVVVRAGVSVRIEQVEPSNAALARVHWLGPDAVHEIARLEHRPVTVERDFARRFAAALGAR